MLEKLKESVGLTAIIDEMNRAYKQGGAQVQILKQIIKERVEAIRNSLTNPNLTPLEFVNSRNQWKALSVFLIGNIWEAKNDIRKQQIFLINMLSELNNIPVLSKPYNTSMDLNEENALEKTYTTLGYRPIDQISISEYYISLVELMIEEAANMVNSHDIPYLGKRTMVLIIMFIKKLSDLNILKNKDINRLNLRIEYNEDSQTLHVIFPYASFQNQRPMHAIEIVDIKFVIDSFGQLADLNSILNIAKKVSPIILSEEQKGILETGKDDLELLSYQTQENRESLLNTTSIQERKEFLTSTYGISFFGDPLGKFAFRATLPSNLLNDPNFSVLTDQLFEYEIDTEVLNNTPSYNVIFVMKIENIGIDKARIWFELMPLPKTITFRDREEQKNEKITIFVNNSINPKLNIVENSEPPIQVFTWGISHIQSEEDLKIKYDPASTYSMYSSLGANGKSERRYSLNKLFFSSKIGFIEKIEFNDRGEVTSIRFNNEDYPVESEYDIDIIAFIKSPDHYFIMDSENNMKLKRYTETKEGVKVVNLLNNLAAIININLSSLITKNDSNLTEQQALGEFVNSLIPQDENDINLVMKSIEYIGNVYEELIGHPWDGYNILDPILSSMSASNELSALQIPQNIAMSIKVIAPTTIEDLLKLIFSLKGNSEENIQSVVRLTIDELLRSNTYQNVENAIATILLMIHLALRKRYHYLIKEARSVRNFQNLRDEEPPQASDSTKPSVVKGIDNKQDFKVVVGQLSVQFDSQGYFMGKTITVVLDNVDNNLTFYYLPAAQSITNDTVVNFVIKLNDKFYEFIIYNNAMDREKFLINPFAYILFDEIKKGDTLTIQTKVPLKDNGEAALRSDVIQANTMSPVLETPPQTGNPVQLEAQRKYQHELKEWYRSFDNQAGTIMNLGKSKNLRLIYHKRTDLEEQKDIIHFYIADRKGGFYEFTYVVTGVNLTEFFKNPDKYIEFIDNDEDDGVAMQIIIKPPLQSHVTVTTSVANTTSEPDVFSFE